MASIFHASRHFVLFSIGFARVVIDSLISFNYKVNDFSAPPRAGYSLLSAIKAVVEVDDRVTNQRPCRNTHHIQTSPSSSGSPSLRGASYTNAIPQPLINFADIVARRWINQLTCYSWYRKQIKLRLQSKSGNCSIPLATFH